MAMPSMMKMYDRIPVGFSGAVLPGKKGVVIRPGGKISFQAALPKHDFPVRRRLRISGEVDIFWQWRCEGGMPLLYRSIKDALDAENAYCEKYSLHLRSNFDPWRRNAFIMLPLGGVPRGTPLTFSAMAMARNLKLAQGGEVCAELGVYMPREGRHPQDVTELPDMVHQLRLDEGTYGWRQLSSELRIPQDAASVLIRVGGTGFGGDAWIGSPRLYAENGDTLIPPLMPENPHPSWRQLNWLGENLSRLEQPEFRISADGKIFFCGAVFNSISRFSEFEVSLPDMADGTHEFVLELIDGHADSLPFMLQGADILLESARPVEIVAYPEYPEEKRPFGVLLERNYEDGCRLEVATVEDAGPARANPSFPINLDGAAMEIRPRRVVRNPGDEIILSTGDAIYISQDIGDFMRYLEWYVANGIGNGVCIRPAYRWGGGRSMNPELWKIAVPLMEKLGIKYHLMVDGRELPGSNVTPRDDDLAGPNYLGRQEHERDGAFSYWGHIREDALYTYIFNRAGSEQTHLGLAAPALPQNGIISGCFDQGLARDMKEAAKLFIENVRLAKKSCTRHTGPSTLFHYFYQEGYEWLGAEQMYGPEEVILSSLRGASKSYGRKDFGAHLAVQWSSAPHDTQAHALRYFLSLATCYMQGASGINTEEGLWRMDAGYAPFDRFSRCCEIHRQAHARFRRFLQTHPRRGVMRVPLAVLQGRYCGWRCFSRANVWGSNRDEFRFSSPEESFDLLKVFYPRSILDAIYRFPCDDASPQGWYSGTPFGPVDLIPVNGPNPQLASYAALAFLGWNTFAEEDFQRLSSYVEQGGRLLLARPHLSTETRRNRPSMLPEDSPALSCLIGNQAYDDSKVSRKLGKGAVVYFPQDEYPSKTVIRGDYEAELRSMGELAASAEARRGWIRGGEDVSFAAYDWEDGRLRTIYLLNIDHWSGRASAPAHFLFGGKSYCIDVRSGTIEVVTASNSVAAMPEGHDADVMEIEELPGKLRIVVQSDAGAELRLFAPAHANCPPSIRVEGGGVQEIEVST